MNAPIPQSIAVAAVSMLAQYIEGLTEDDLQSLRASAKSDDTLLKVKEAAERLNVSEITIRRMINSGRLNAIKIGGSLRVSYNSIKTMLESK